jgi:hypothetical protein
MATKIKNWFKQSFNNMVEARQRQVNRMIDLQGYRGWQ